MTNLIDLNTVQYDEEYPKYIINAIINNNEWVRLIKNKKLFVIRKENVPTPNKGMYNISGGIGRLITTLTTSKGEVSFFRINYTNEIICIY